jgi:hypothetical protein
VERRFIFCSRGSPSSSTSAAPREIGVADSLDFFRVGENEIGLEVGMAAAQSWASKLRPESLGYGSEHFAFPLAARVVKGTAEAKR